MKTFPAIILGAFVVLAVIAAGIFATFNSIRTNAVGAVVVWGSMPDSEMSQVIAELKAENSAFTELSYRSIPESELLPDLIAAIASGNGPDLVLFPASDLLSQSDKLQTIEYSALSARTFKDTFVQAGEVFMASDGIRGIPFTIDPLVMYWNRSLFSAVGVSQPPVYWDDVSTIAPRLSKTDGRGTLSQSAVAFGTWDNVSNAKDIFISILNQLGNPIVVTTEKGYASVLSGDGTGTSGAESALRFYTDFADPAKLVYSWNRSQPNSHDAFIGGTLAIYFGHASELLGIRSANPNLNFDVAPVPQIRGGNASTAARVVGLSIPRGSRNPQGALLAAQALTANSSQITLSNILGLPSVRRDITPDSAKDAYAIIFRNTALSAFSFPDPSPSATDSIFGRMVQNVTSGKNTPSEAINNAQTELNALLGSQ